MNTETRNGKSLKTTVNQIIDSGTCSDFEKFSMFLDLIERMLEILLLNIYNKLAMPGLHSVLPPSALPR